MLIIQLLNYHWLLSHFLLALVTQLNEAVAFVLHKAQDVHKSSHYQRLESLESNSAMRFPSCFQATQPDTLDSVSATSSERSSPNSLWSLLLLTSSGCHVALEGIGLRLCACCRSMCVHLFFVFVSQCNTYMTALSLICNGILWLQHCSWMELSYRYLEM